MLRAYLAGPDVFLPDAMGHASRKVAICARHGMVGCSPAIAPDDPVLHLPPPAAWQAIYDRNLILMESADLVIANLTPFRSASADSGTLVELGWFLGRGRPAFGYSNTAASFAERSRALAAAWPDPLPGLMVEGFDLSDNLMIPGAVQQGGGLPITLPPDGQDLAFDSLAVFEHCVARVAAHMAAPRP